MRATCATGDATSGVSERVFLRRWLAAVLLFFYVTSSLTRRALRSALSQPGIENIELLAVVYDEYPPESLIAKANTHASRRAMPAQMRKKFRSMLFSSTLSTNERTKREIIANAMLGHAVLLHRFSLHLSRLLAHNNQGRLFEVPSSFAAAAAAATRGASSATTTTTASTNSTTNSNTTDAAKRAERRLHDVAVAAAIIERSRQIRARSTLTTTSVEAMQMAEQRIRQIERARLHESKSTTTTITPAAATAAATTAATTTTTTTTATTTTTTTTTTATTTTIATPTTTPTPIATAKRKQVWLIPGGGEADFPAAALIAAQLRRAGGDDDVAATALLFGVDTDYVFELLSHGAFNCILVDHRRRRALSVAEFATCFLLPLLDPLLGAIISLRPRLATRLQESQHSTTAPTTTTSTTTTTSSSSSTTTTTTTLTSTTSTSTSTTTPAAAATSSADPLPQAGQQQRRSRWGVLERDDVNNPALIALGRLAEAIFRNNSTDTTLNVLGGKQFIAFARLLVRLSLHNFFKFNKPLIIIE